MPANVRFLTAAIATNATMGLIYLWSLFLLPLESALPVSRSLLSVVPALSLLMFTAGMYSHDALLRRIGLNNFVLLSFGLAGIGHLLFGFWPTYATLVTGYGVLFGFASGLGYGLALALAGQLAPRSRALGVGVTVASFAISGVILAKMLPPLFASEGLAGSFLMIGAAILVAGIAILGLLAGLSPLSFAGGTRESSSATNVRRVDLVPLSVCFFVICYSGLMLVSHSTGILQEVGFKPENLFLGPVILNCAYIVGSLIGGRIAERVSGRMALLSSLAVQALALAVLYASANGIVAATATFLIGLTFGGSASLMPVLIGERFGFENVGSVYGRMMVAYGAAGLTAPWITAYLYTHDGGYRWALLLACALTAIGFVLALFTSGKVEARV